MALRENDYEGLLGSEYTGISYLYYCALAILISLHASLLSWSNHPNVYPRARLEPIEFWGVLSRQYYSEIAHSADKIRGLCISLSSGIFSIKFKETAWLVHLGHWGETFPWSNCRLASKMTRILLNANKGQPLRTQRHRDNDPSHLSQLPSPIAIIKGLMQNDVRL